MPPRDPSPIPHHESCRVSDIIQSDEDGLFDCTRCGLWGETFAAAVPTHYDGWVEDYQTSPHFEDAIVTVPRDRHVAPPLPASDQLRVRRLVPDAQLPSRANPGDAGLDLYAHCRPQLECDDCDAAGEYVTWAEDPGDGNIEKRWVKCSTCGGTGLIEGDRLFLEPGGTVLVNTGIQVAVPEGYAGLVLPRSGLAKKHGITIPNAPGLIDSGYRGEVGVLLQNLGRSEFIVKHGDRIAQLLIVPAPEMGVVEVEMLEETERGQGGFGSSGR